MNKFHRFMSVAAVAGAALLAGCAGLRTVDTSVATQGTWPAGVSPGTYAFDSLPSQERYPQRDQAMENAAAQALAAAGFRPAADGSKPSVIVQFGVRAAHYEQIPWEGDFWFTGPGRRYGLAGWAPYGSYDAWGPFRLSQSWGPYLNEVALLIRDAGTGKTLYETQVSYNSNARRSDRLIAAMFDASMKEFPRTNDKPHEVRVPLQMEPPAKAASAPSA